MPLPLASKDKSARLDWGYHARPSGFARTRRRLGLLAGAVALLLGGLAVAAAVGRVPQPLATAASRGPLARAHARWDNQCEACHTPFEPIHAAAGKCQTCHAAPAHHPAQKPAEVAACAECHRDHQGRDHDLKRLADATCTGCHADLSAHHTGTPRVAEAVSGFATHPPFRNNPADTSVPFRRTLKFAHAAHLTASPMMDSYLSQMSPADRERYTPVVDALRRGDKSAACGSCHAFDANRPAGAASPLSLAELFGDRTRDALRLLPADALLPPRTGGSHPLPVAFEAHCQACHPLTFDVADGLKGTSAPHRAPADELDRFLRRAYTERLVTEGLAGGNEPDRGPGRLDPPATVVEEVRGKIAGRLADAKRTLAATCGQCHPAGAAGGVVPPNTPAVWQPRARFDHPSHRMMTCQQCHPGAFGPDAGEKYQPPPDLPTIQNCQTCHSPAGGVSHGCTDCHSYHHADRRLQGRGAAAFRPAAEAGTMPAPRGGLP